MAKGVIILDEIPKTCIECPMHFYATDMSIGNFQFEREDVIWNSVAERANSTVQTITESGYARMI